MTTYKLNELKMYSDIEEEIAIIINSETGIYYGMNKLGTIIFENLIKGVPYEKILAKFKDLENFEESNFNNYIDFVIENEENNIDIDFDFDIDETIIKEDLCMPKVKEYLDVQELLFADPIHEVKEDEGWSPEKSSLNEDLEDVEKRKEKMKKN